MMKRLTAIILTITLMLTLAACGVDNNDNSTTNGSNNSTNTPTSESTPGSDSNTPGDNGSEAIVGTSGIYVSAAGRDRDGHFAEVQSWQDIVQISTAGYVYPSIMGYSTLITAV